MVVDEEGDGHDSSTGLGGHDSDLGRAVVGSISGLEGLGPNDVTNGEGTSNERSGDCSLGVAGDVGHGPLVDDGEGTGDGVDEIDTSKETCTVLGGEEGHQTATNHTRNTAESEPGPTVFSVADAVTNNQGGDDGDNTAGHVEEGSAVRAEAEALDESRGVGGDHTRGDRNLS